MALTTVLTRNSALRHAMTVALRAEHAVTPVATWARLKWAVRECPVTCMVIDIAALKTAHPEDELLEIARRYPSVGMVLVAGEDVPVGRLFHLGRAGVSGLILLSVDGLVRDLPRAVRRALIGSTAAVVTRMVSPGLTRKETEAVRLALEAPQRGWGTEEVAERIGLTRPHVSVRLDARGLPSLGHLVIWGRILHGGHWLAEPGRSAESVSRQLGYANGSAFRRALRNYVGCTPTEVVEGGGLSLVLERFAEACDLVIHPRALNSVA